MSTAHIEPPITDAGRGFIEKIDQSGSRLHIQGWVAAHGSGEPADYVTILISGNPARNVVHELQMRVDVNQHLGLPDEVRRGFVIACDLPESRLSASDFTIIAVFRSGARFAMDASGITVTGLPGSHLESWAKKFRAALYPFPSDSVFAGIYSLELNYDLAQLKGVTSQFLDEASVYHSKYNNHPLWTTLLENAFQAIPEFQTPREVLDIGSGSGNTVIPLLRLFPGVRVVAVDISPQLLAILRDQMTPDQRDRCLLIAADASDRIFASDTFDLVIGAAILHHIMDPTLTISSCLDALCKQCFAIFFEPFEAGASILRLLYGRLIEKSEELNLSPAVVGALQRLSYDFAVRAGTDKSAPIYRDLDDKWLFTRTYFEGIKATLPVSEITIRPLYFSDDPFASQVRTHLRLCLGVGPEVLPQAAWKLVNEFEETFSPDLRREMLIEGAIMMKKAAAS